MSNYTLLFTILAFFTIISATTIMPTAFADHATATVSVPSGSSVPGCEETNECYIPHEVTIDVGGEVTWTNDDSAAHTVTSGTPADGPDGLFDSSLFMAGAEYSVKFDDYQPGEYPYFCMVHPWMEGIVSVQEAGSEEEMGDEEHDSDQDSMHGDDAMENKETIKRMVGGVDVTMAPPVEGSKDAPVTIIEFGDFQCPKCDQWFQNEKPTIKKDYIDTDKAKLYFVDFSFLGRDSDVAANASYCADDQGKYWEYHYHLYNNQGGINDGWASPANLKQFAADLGLDMDKFNSCLDSNTHKDRVDYNRKVGASNGVQGTPVFVIVDSDGATQRIEGPQSSGIFAGVIDTMLEEPIKEAAAQTEELEDMQIAPAEEPPGGGCLIATAAFGTEMAPQVQLLREVRDGKVMSTDTGTAFLSGFNTIYYSFSPAIADMERENSVFQEGVRMLITPMVSTLSIMTLAEDGNEAHVLGLGISVIALNLGMYVVAPAVAGLAVSKHLKSRK